MHERTPLREHQDTFVRKDGTFLPVVFSAVPIVNQGSVAGLIVVFRDDTNRRTAEQALRESEERLRMLIEHAPAAIAMLDRKMCYLLASMRWMQDYGLTDDIKGRCHYDLFPKILDHWKEVHQRGLAGETIRADDERFERADGTMQWIKWEVRP